VRYIAHLGSGGFALIPESIAALAGEERIMEAHGITQAAYEDRLRFETLISDLSARFIKLPAIKVNQEINRDAGEEPA
jgi:hypothetical protein